MDKAVVQETLKLIGVVESQSRELMDSRNNASPYFQDYKRFVEKIEHFYVFVDLVEGRIPEFDVGKREPLRKHLSKIRWKVIILELDTTRVYMVQITQSGRKLPLGAREFLQRRLDRLSEIATYYDRFGDEHELAPPADMLLRAVEELLRVGIEQAPKLDEFSAAMAGAGLPSSGRSATPEAPSRIRRLGISVDGMKAALPATPLGQQRGMSNSMAPPPLPEKIKVKESWGRFYVEKGTMVAVTQACKVASISLDQLAERIGVSRVALSLMLNGQDAMNRQTMERLQGFMGEQAKRLRPRD
ncbi:helix-turn-helix domain-containing protein [Ferrovibrio sp.]|uniref:helix-turn-helix domain-containing protein n=1 Tax=Ferrovibrio sp. TaxID=1917215 RepID=UPI0035B46294